MSRVDDLLAGALQRRSTVEVEDVDEAKHEIYMRAAPYLEEFTDIGGGILERFRPGTFARAANAPHRLALWDGHGGPVVGRGTAVEESPDGSWVRMRLGRTQSANDLLMNVQDGITSDPSVEFRPIPGYMDVERVGDSLRVSHRRAQLNGVAMVTLGAYEDQAFVVSARDAARDREREEFEAWLQEFRHRRR